MEAGEAEVELVIQGGSGWAGEEGGGGEKGREKGVGGAGR